MSKNKDGKLKDTFDKILNEEMSFHELGLQLGKLKRISTMDPLRTLDVMFLRENHNINKSIKRLTILIALLTVINLLLVAATIYY